MKKSLMALGGDDTKEEIRDLLNQSDISIIGAKVITEKSPKSTKLMTLYISRRPLPPGCHFCFRLFPPFFPMKTIPCCKMDLTLGPIKDILFLSLYNLLNLDYRRPLTANK